MNKKVKSLILIPILLGVLALTLTLVRQRQETRRGAAGFATATVLLNPESVEVKKGQTFDVDVMLNTEATVSATSLIVCYDNKLSLESEDDLISWSSEGGKKLLVGLIDRESQNGLICKEIVLTGNTTDDNLPIGFFKLLNIKMKAIAEGEAKFELIKNDSVLVGVNNESENKTVDMEGDGTVVNVEVMPEEDSLLLMSYDVSARELVADEEMNLLFFADTVGEKTLDKFDFEICVHNSMDFVKKIDQDCEYIIEKDSLYHRDLNCFKISGSCVNKSGKLKIADLYFKPNVSRTEAPFIINDDNWFFDGFAPQWVSGYDNVFAVKVGGGLDYLRCNLCQIGDKSKGDANCDGKINLVDFEIWRSESFDINDEDYDWTADFDCSDELQKPNLVDFSIWKDNYLLN
jgi:hypothetical protein